MRAVFRPVARLEALAAQAWFEARFPGLGFDFARALDVAVAAAQRSPLAYRQIELGCRRVVLRRFPSALIYRIRDTEFLVVAIFHHRRKPGTWHGRVGG